TTLFRPVSTSAYRKSPWDFKGDHAKIAEWRRREAERNTRERRPDLSLPSGSGEGSRADSHEVDPSRSVIAVPQIDGPPKRADPRQGVRLRILWKSFDLLGKSLELLGKGLDFPLN